MPVLPHNAQGKLHIRAQPHREVGTMGRRTPGRHEDKEKIRKGGSAQAPAMAGPVAPNAYVKAGLIGGLASGLIFLALQVVLSATVDVLAPFRTLASLFLAEAAMSESAPVVTAALVGLLDNALVSAFWGLVFGLALSCGKRGWTAGAVVTLGMLFGAVVWVVDFYIFAPLFWPWIQGASSVFQFVGHVFFFGLPLGVWVSWHTSERVET